VFDIQRTMREAYDRARRVLHQSETSRAESLVVHQSQASMAEAQSVPSNDSSPTHKSGRLDVAKEAVTMTTSLSDIGHCGDCPSTCTCFMVCDLFISSYLLLLFVYLLFYFFDFILYLFFCVLSSFVY